MTKFKSRFAKLLGEKMCEKSLNATMLAKKIEPSKVSTYTRLINAWLRGERVPNADRVASEGDPGQNCIAQLADVLDIPVDHLERLRQEAVEERQTYLREKRKERPKKIEEQLRRHLRPRFLSSEGSDSDVEIPEGAKGVILTEQKNIAKAMFAIAKHWKESVEQSTLLLTAQKEDPILIDDEEKDAWLDILIEGLDKGCCIDHIVRLSQNFRKSDDLVERILQCMGRSGEYNAYSFNQSQEFPFSCDFIGIQGKETLLIFSSNFGIYIEAEVEELEQKIFESAKASATKIFTVYSSTEQQELADELREIENLTDVSTETLVIGQRLSQMLQPPEWFNSDNGKISRWAEKLRNYLQNHPEFGGDFGEELRHRREYYYRQRSRLQGSQHKHIYPQSCIDKYVNEGKMFPYYFDLDPSEPKDQEIIKKHFEEIMNTLDNENYEMAIAGGKIDALISASYRIRFFEARRNSASIIEISEKSGLFDGSDGYPKWVIIRDQFINRLFFSYFSRLWEEIPETEKNKYYVAKKIQQKIDELCNRCERAELVNE